MRHFFTVSRFIIMLAVIDSLLMSVTLLIYGSIDSLRMFFELFNSMVLSGEKVPKEVALMAIKTVDLLLIGTVLYIIGLGLYKLFIDENLPVSSWLEVHSLDDLKHTLMGVLTIVLAVLFLEQVIAWNPPENLLYLGVPIALVIAALAYFQSHAKDKDKGDDDQ